ncbi:unnamed protein product [Mytilus coruscus]|uniref:Uncharacterized protein n=1 Tax=Mytilus coruscus TaxID=42192 RepID=A0A6J8DKQ3_MYTCO|nr:unnamed protein product [Mytilus coruscus]
MKRRSAKVNSLDNVYISEYVKRQLEGKLFRAILDHKFKLARILVEGDVNVNCRLRTGVTPLILICDQKVEDDLRRMQLHLVRCLINRSADVNAKDNFGRTALTYAFLSGDLQLVRLLELNGSSSWIWDVNISFYRQARESVLIISDLNMHFHRWNSNDFAKEIN